MSRSVIVYWLLGGRDKSHLEIASILIPKILITIIAMTLDNVFRKRFMI